MTRQELTQLFEVIEQLDDEQLDRLREWVGRLKLGRPVSVDRLYGSLPDEDARAMATAIEEAFEQIEPDGPPPG